MTKYKQYYQNMMEQEKQKFAEFKKIHDKFELDKDKNREEFNQVGQKVVDVIRDWDRRLCSAMGRGVFSKYSEQLSDKFWGEVRKEFKLIDLVGVKTRM
jgi:sugar-specific transcriptional regulator TrmB